MPIHSHKFVEEYDGIVGFGFDRETDESTVVYYLQKFSDDELMALLRPRISDADLKDVFDLVGRLLKGYLSNEEYHKYFLRDEVEE